MRTGLVLLWVVACGAPKSGDDSSGTTGTTGTSVTLPTTDTHPPATDTATAWWLTASDAFDGDLSRWTPHRSDDATFEVVDGALVLQPQPNTLWFNDQSTFGLFQTVSGDLAITAPVWVHRASDADAAPAVPFRLGGIMLRDPTEDGTEDYVFLVLGTDGDDLSVETKSTDDDVSVFVGPPWPSTRAELRICRVGPTFRFLARGDGDWEALGDFERPDLPTALLAGPMTYANVPDPDLVVGFDAVRFAPLTDLEDCSRL